MVSLLVFSFFGTHPANSKLSADTQNNGNTWRCEQDSNKMIVIYLMFFPRFSGEFFSTLNINNKLRNNTKRLRAEKGQKHKSLPDAPETLGGVVPVGMGCISDLTLTQGLSEFHLS